MLCLLSSHSRTSKFSVTNMLGSLITLNILEGYSQKTLVVLPLQTVLISTSEKKEKLHRNFFSLPNKLYSNSGSSQASQGLF